MGDVVMRTDDLSPVDGLVLTSDVMVSGRLEGYAWPAAGVRCCGLSLWADDRLISVARADTFCDEARSRSVRQGWCGFRVGGYHQAIALGDVIELRCSLSGHALKRWEAMSIAGELSRPRKAAMSFESFWHELKHSDGCTDVGHIVPFARDTVAERGREAFLDASFRYVLKRNIDDHGRENTHVSAGDDREIVKFLKGLLGSEEYRRLNDKKLVSPFHSDFPFVRTCLDSRGVSQRQ